MVAGAERAKDFIPTNRWLRTVDLPGRIAFMSLPRSRGRSPRQGHEEGAREPLRFYQQIQDNEDLAMLVVPPKFVEVMNTWLVIKRLPRVVRLSANKRCVFSVQVQNFEGHMVLGQGWNYFCRRHRIVPATSSLCASQDSPSRSKSTTATPRSCAGFVAAGTTALVTSSMLFS